MLTWLKKQIIGTAGTPQTPAEALYYALLEASRTPGFYVKYGAEDSFDGRFDVLCILVSLMMRRLRDEGETAKVFSQSLFDAMFTDIDLTLREQGAGDTGLGKRIRIMSEGFAGRLTSYSAALDDEDTSGLAQAIARNLRRSDEVSETDLALSHLAVGLSKALVDMAYSDISSGDFDAKSWVHVEMQR